MPTYDSDEGPLMNFNQMAEYESMSDDDDEDFEEDGGLLTNF